MAAVPNAHVANAKQEHLQLLCETITKLNYKEQGIFFLNAYWKEHGETESEKVWGYVQTAEECDKNNGSNGHSMDEFEAHQFLERYGKPLTVIAMRKELRKIDVDDDHKMALLEYFVYHYDLDIDTLMTRPQGVNKALEDAEAALNQVLSEIEKIEQKKAKLVEKANGSGVKAMTARNELAQLTSSDPLPLRQALMTAQAALRKAKKSKDLSAMGKLFFINRQMDEVAKYKPKANWKRANLDMQSL
eukprot:384587_1